MVANRYIPLEPMKANGKELLRMESELARKSRLSLKKKFVILDGLYREALFLGVFPLKDPLEGLEIDIKLARALNGVSNDGSLDENFLKSFGKIEKEIR